MAFTNYTGSIDTIQSLSDRPNQEDNLTPAQLKLKFDQAAIDIQDYINSTLIPQLIASNIPISAIGGLTATQVQAALAELKSQLSTYVLGGIPDGTLTDAKMASNFRNRLLTLTAGTYDNLDVSNIDVIYTNTTGGGVVQINNFITTKPQKVRIVKNYSSGTVIVKYSSLLTMNTKNGKDIVLTTPYSFAEAQSMTGNVWFIDCANNAIMDDTTTDKYVTGINNGALYYRLL
jgi:hypothetical protein